MFTEEDLSKVPNIEDAEVTIPNISPIIFTQSGIQHLLSTLDVSKASGPDRVSPYILKHCAEELSPVLQIIFTQSLTTGVLPPDWLSANICPVYKKGSRSSPCNYRPISLTPICSKIMEHIIYHSIMNHLNLNNILIDNQHGFRANHSCTTQLIAFIEDVSHALDHQKQVDIILLDFSKAFDTVPHQRLLSKLKHYGITNEIYNWIKTWLTQRIQRVVLDGEVSDQASVLSGVPQGTVLGPLMFLLYINDISKHINSPLRLFADDCLLYRVISCKDDASLLQEDLDRLYEWTKIWQLSFNIKKCVLLRCTRSLSPYQCNYTLNKDTLATTDQHRYLGVLLDKRLSWSPHISSIASKASQTLNFLKRNLSKCSTAIKASAYLTMIRPIMEYASAVWDPFYVKDIQQLEKVQRRAACWVLNDYRHTSSVTLMLKQLSWPTLTLCRRISRLSILYKAIQQQLSLTIPSYYLPPMIQSTRQYHPSHFVLPCSSTTSYQHSYFTRTIKDWNSLPTAIIETNSYNQFLSKLQTYIAN